ncbi:MAG TPA: SAM-dependent chlorinase/fluorinase [Steroidobacteraceae bacterium]|nr:SAM-dependent chlorinase/fluorinase [Steroidobacteraceae bacterium]
MSAFRPCGIVTLTTDFGLEDPFVGVVKGRILTRFPTARLIDVTHAIPPQRPAEAGFWLARCFEYFPAGTVHVAIVDPGVGTARAIICVAARGHALIAPDNGLLEPVVARSPDCEIYELSAATLAALGIRAVSATFHGRDIFAPVAAELAAGRLSPDALGMRRAMPMNEPPAARAATEAGQAVSGRVITIDHFGNLITDIDSSRLTLLREAHVTIGGRVIPYRRTYGDARPGELIALMNSFDTLEIAQTDGNAAATLGLGRGAPVLVWSSPLPVERNPL